MIYFMAPICGGPVKVGTTNDVGRRRRELEADYSCPLAVLHVMPGGRDEERAILVRFAHLRIGDSEQLRPAPDLFEFMGRPLLVGPNPEAVEAWPVADRFGLHASPAMGEAIREAREAKGLTRREVGEALSIHGQYLYQVETGRRRPTLETLWEIATYLGINPHTLDERLASVPKSKGGHKP